MYKRQPLLMIQPADTAIYRVQRDTYGESFVLTELYGTAGETLYYTDTSAKPGVCLLYTSFFRDVCAANFAMDSLRMRPLKLIYIKAWFSRLFFI